MKKHAFIVTVMVSLPGRQHGTDPCLTDRLVDEA